ncbi:cleavage polyadenylation factor subunit fip1 [Puccinia graminis f. sp. tritici]|uniref:Cleavage polyadenylation factor subunit fip1 n=1 Tax=Puccinia graminis f. sp. tritici TaxID=56615 RepID=A0A5B0SFT2_PUCGR|nr:cleavage polyadenylation factor subunit fip1 [Puccinia graminis f. sp. tritici]
MSATECASVRPVSPLPLNVPTGPRRAAPASGAPPPRGPHGVPGGYFDKDAAGGREDAGLDYGGGGGDSPREDRKSISRRHSHNSERDRSEKDSQRFERGEDPADRSRSKSRDKELVDEKEILHKSSKSRHRHRARSKSKDPVEHRSSREKGDKEKDETGHKPSKSANGEKESAESSGD